MTLFSLNKPEASFIVFGCIASLLTGAVQPSFALLFARNMTLLSNPPPSAIRDATLLAVLFLLIGFLDLLLHLLQGFLFGFSGHALTTRLRFLFFRSVVSKEIEFFDRPGNSVARFTAQLATDCSKIQGLTGMRIGRILEAASTSLVAVGMAFAYEWRLASFLMLTFPLLALGAFLELETLSMKGFIENSVAEMEEEKAAQVAAEALENIRTVAAFGQENSVASAYETHLSLGHSFGKRRYLAHAAAFAYSQSVYLFVEAGGFVFAAYLIGSCHATYSEIIAVFAVIVFSAQSLADAFAALPNYADAKDAAARLFGEIDGENDRKKDEEKDAKKEWWEKENDVEVWRKKSSLPDGIPVDHNANSVQVIPQNFATAVVSPGYAQSEYHRVKNNSNNNPNNNNNNPNNLVDFKDVGFRYPTRPRSAVLSSFDLQLRCGTIHAIVGPSGSGKSTVAELLARFYSPDSGSILLNGVNLASIAPSDFCQKIALVSQESPLFSGSFSENIGYAADDQLQQAELMSAAEASDILDVILRHPMKFEGGVGAKGSAVSVGQRQRIAIARAIARKPKLLILDEATSALDARTESIVLDNVFNLSKLSGMTVLVIAHKLRSITDADCISVMHRGAVIEAGTHEQLMRKKGFYYTMFKTQSS